MRTAAGTCHATVCLLCVCLEYLCGSVSPAEAYNWPKKDRTDSRMKDLSYCLPGVISHKLG
jgi:hypothetical protein